MTHPVMHGASQQYGQAPAGGGQPPAPPGPPPAWQQPGPRKQRNLAIPLAIAVTALIALVVGGIVGAALRGTAAPPAPQAEPAADAPGAPVLPEAAPSAAEVHAQDVALCTKYAIINAAKPKPDKTALEILPAATALQNALADNPHASTRIRVALTDVVSAYYARMAAYGKIEARGLADPPPYDLEVAQAAHDQAWAVCGFD